MYSDSVTYFVLGYFLLFFFRMISYLKLYQLHSQHHVLQATSAGSERAFGVTRLMCNDRRIKLKENIFELLVLVKSNIDLL